MNSWDYLRRYSKEEIIYFLKNKYPCNPPTESTIKSFIKNRKTNFLKDKIREINKEKETLDPKKDKDKILEINQMQLMLYKTIIEINGEE